MGWCLEWVGRHKVVVLKEVPTKLGCEKQDCREDDEKHRRAHDVVHGVVRVKRNAIERNTLRVFQGLDVHAIWVVRTHFVQRDDVSADQSEEHQRNGDHVEREETIQRCVRHHKVAANQERKIGSDEGNRREQVHDDLCTPVRHLTPRE